MQKWVKLCGVCLSLYVSKLVNKQYLHGSGFLLIFLNFSDVWEVQFLVCTCSHPSVVLYTRIGVVLLSLCAWVRCISCGYSLEHVLCSVHFPLDFELHEFVHFQWCSLFVFVVFDVFHLNLQLIQIVEHRGSINKYRHFIECKTSYYFHILYRVFLCQSCNLHFVFDV